MDTPDPVAARLAAQISTRKAEHLVLAARAESEGPCSAGWEDVALIPNCLPEIDLDGVQLAVTFLDRRLGAPLVIAGMTGGHPAAVEVNRRLARAAERYGLAMGVGSQRAALRAPELGASYAVAREAAPTACLIANVGAPQLIAQADGTSPAIGLAEAEQAVALLRADALAVHLNFLQEGVQPEGDQRGRGVATALAALARALPVPLIAKETGGGMARPEAEQLRGLGVAALDVGGAGGTSFARIEGQRAAQANDPLHARLGELFAGWGVPTAAAVLEARATGLPLIATGGVRSGLDAARALALGATLVGVGRPLLAAALESDAAVAAWIEQFLAELRLACWLSGAATPAALAARGYVLHGRTREWATQREL